MQSKGQDIVQRSVLGPVLPEAMVCYLENYEAERFSEIFLGEFDTPEAIWSSEMRSGDPLHPVMNETPLVHCFLSYFYRPL